MELNQKLYLFQLIKSLSSSEKGYVKKYCTKNGAGAAYLKLFDAIDKQDKYDEEALKKKFRKEKFVNQLSVAKNYLIKTILKSLRAYYSESSKNIQVHELLLEIEILYNKRLIGLCQKLIKKTKKIIIDSELFSHYSELAFWEFKLAILTIQEEGTEQLMQEIEDFAAEGAQKDALLSLYRHLAYRVYTYGTREGYTREEETISLTDNFSKNPLLQAVPSPGNARAIGRYYNIWTKIYELRNDFEGSYRASIGFLKIIQANPQIFSDFLMPTVIPAHYNVLGRCILLNEEEDFFNYLADLKAIPKVYRSKNESIIDLVNYYAISLELHFYTQNAHFNQAKSILPQAEAIVKTGHLTEIGLTMQHIEIAYSIAYAHFGLGNYNESENWVAIALDYQKANIREDIMCLTQLLHLTNHAQMGSYQYLTHRLRSSYNFIKKRDRAYDFERLTLQFLKKLINSYNDKAALNNLYTVYKAKFEEFEDDPFVKAILKNFDIISHLESLIQNIPFAVVAHRRRNNPKR